MSIDKKDDKTVIVQLITKQFTSLQWESGDDADWADFAETFIADAPLYPAARPAKAMTVNAFKARMQRLAAQGTLRTFSERPLGVQVQVFGNVAVAFAGCEMTENGETLTRDASAFLLLRSEEKWLIAAQAWDVENQTNPLPLELSTALSQPAL